MGGPARRRWAAAAVLAACVAAAFVVFGQARGWPWRARGPERLVDRMSPELPTLSTLDGRPLRLADRRGRVVLLVFWGWGCTIVDELLPRMGEWERRFSPRGLAVAGVYTPEPGDGRVRQLERLGLERPAWPIALDEGARSWPAFGVRDSPTVFLIDREGRVRSARAGAGIGDAVEEDIRRLVEGR